MEETELTPPKIDLFRLLRIWVRYARRFWALALMLAILGAGVSSILCRRGYAPVYEASLSFTVRASDSHCNAAAKQLNSTVSGILRSELLRRRVAESLGVSEIPPVTTTVMENSGIFTMRVRHMDPEWAYEVLRAMLACYPQIADYVVGGTELVILDEGGIPTRPVYEIDLTGCLLTGAVGGVAMWCVFVLLRVLCRNTIYDEEELLQIVDCACLGVIPSAGKAGKELRYDYVRTGFAESVRLLQMHVSKMMKEQNRKVLLVSGAISGEGKTTVAVNLAITAAKAGHCTLLVDCDHIKSSAFKSLCAEKDRTLVDYMRGDATAEELVHGTEIRDLYCMNTGADVEEKKVKESLDGILRAARERFDVIILDTPSCSLTVDAAELSDLADCGLMVVRQDYAARDQILEGMSMLTESGMPLLGCAMNEVSGCAYRYGRKHG